MNAGNLDTTNLLLGVMAVVSVLEAAVLHHAQPDARVGDLQHRRRGTMEEDRAVADDVPQGAVGRENALHVGSTNAPRVRKAQPSG